MCSSVDLPEPDSPRIAHHSPRATARLTSARSGGPAANALARPRTSSMPGSEPGGDAEPRSQQAAQGGTGEEPALLREHRDRRERDGDLEKRHRDREEMVGMEGLSALLVPALVGRLVLAGVRLDLFLLGGVAFRLAAIEVARLRVGD